MVGYILTGQRIACFTLNIVSHTGYVFDVVYTKHDAHEWQEMVPLLTVEYGIFMGIKSFCAVEKYTSFGQIILLKISDTFEIGSPGHL